MKPIKIFCLVLALMFIAGFNEQPTKSLHQAAREGDIDQIQFHISRDADVNAKDKHGQMPLHRAAAKGYKHAAELLETQTSS